jgi:oligopeptidase B
MSLVTPRASRRPVARTLHGETMVDPYAWLRDRDAPEVLAHLEAENTYTEAVLAPQAAMRDIIFGEIKARTLETDVSVPVRHGAYWYVMQTEEGKQYPVSCRRAAPPGAADAPDALDSPPEVLLDQNALAGDSPYFALGVHEVSPNHGLLAYSTDYTGGERYTLRIRDLLASIDLPDAIPDTSHSVAWSCDATVLFYTRPDAANRPFQVMRHVIGTSPDADALVYEEHDERMSVGVELSRSEAWIFVQSESHTTSEVWMIDAAKPHEAPRCIRPRTSGVEYWVDHECGSGGGRLVVLTTLDAPNRRIVEAPVTDPSAWTEAIPHRDDVTLDGLDVFASHWVMWCRVAGVTGAQVVARRDGAIAGISELAFDEPVRTVGAGANPEYDTRALRFVYMSLVTPPSVYDHDIATGLRRLRKRHPVLGDFDPVRYVSLREWARAEDGAAVPISLVRHIDTPQDGTAPLVLYGYGAYELSVDPWFSVARLSLLDRGVVFAIAHVRGGGELGRAWYTSGKLAHKHKSFSDFVACAEHLVARGHAHPQRVAARGASAGGLLVGAAMHLRPALFRAVAAEVPFVDMVNTLLDASLPLTQPEWEEWGDPAEPEGYARIRAYAPYENVRPATYPRMLVTAGLHDPRVQYWEPAKWVAALREATTGDAPILLKTDLGAGHGGPSGRYDAWRDEALVLAFLLDALGVPGATAHRHRAAH